MASEIVVSAAHRIVQILEAQGVDYALLGGLALPAWGRIRGTLDVDVLIQTDDLSLASLPLEMRAAGFAVEQDSFLPFGHARHLQASLEDPRTGIQVRVDLFTADAPFHRAAVGRGISVPLGDRDVRVLSCEDLILTKLLADRAIDRADVRDLWTANAEDLDLEYIRRWADELGVSAALGECERGEG